MVSLMTRRRVWSDVMSLKEGIEKPQHREFRILGRGFDAQHYPK